MVQWLETQDEKDSSARLGDKHYRYVTDASPDDLFRIWFDSEQRGVMTLVVEEEDQMKMYSPEIWYIKTKKQELQDRYTFLVEVQDFRKKNIRETTDAHDNGTYLENQGQCELEQIEKELQRLSDRETELRNRKCLQEKLSTSTEITEESSATVQSPSDEELNPTTPEPEVMEAKDLSFSPALVQCPNCQQNVVTEIQHRVGKTSFLLCYLSILLGCVGGCCLLPFFLNCCKDTCHFCPSCHTEIQNVPRI